MLALAHAATQHVANIRVRAGRAADLSAELGGFRAALIGRAFHWMDRADTLERLDRMLDLNGAVVLFDDEHPKIPQNDWRRTYQEIISRYLDDDEDRRRRKSDSYEPHLSVLLNSAFRHLETLGEIVTLTVTADRLIERALSLSSTSEARLGARTPCMVADLAAAFSGWDGGQREEIVEWTAIVASRG
jgi:hypothetical protein